MTLVNNAFSAGNFRRFSKRRERGGILFPAFMITPIMIHVDHWRSFNTQTAPSSLGSRLEDGFVHIRIAVAARASVIVRPNRRKKRDEFSE